MHGKINNRPPLISTCVHTFWRWSQSSCSLIHTEIRYDCAIFHCWLICPMRASTIGGLRLWHACIGVWLEIIVSKFQNEKYHNYTGC